MVTSISILLFVIYLTGSLLSVGYFHTEMWEQFEDLQGPQKELVLKLSIAKYNKMPRRGKNLI